MGERIQGKDGSSSKPMTDLCRQWHSSSGTSPSCSYRPSSVHWAADKRENTTSTFSAPSFPPEDSQFLETDEGETYLMLVPIAGTENSNRKES